MAGASPERGLNSGESTICTPRWRCGVTPFLVRPGHDRSPAWSPDGRTLAVSHDATGSGDGELWTVSADASTLTPLGVVGDHPTFSPDGRIAYEDGPPNADGIAVVDLATLSTLAFPTPAGALQLQPDWLAPATNVDTTATGVPDAVDNCPARRERRSSRRRWRRPR